MEAEREKLENIPVTQKLIDSLYSHRKITFEARNHIRTLFTADKQWGMWVSHLLLTMGVTLLFTGIIFFFAFNWASLNSISKFATIQAGMISCLFGAAFYSLQRLEGQACLLGGSILTGVFLAVFGQVYQTGADSYQLFMMWSLAIAGWTFLSKSAAQWLLLLVITKFAIVLWWQQTAPYSYEIEGLILGILLFFNGATLAVREFFAIKKNQVWLQARWIRVILVLETVASMFIPVFLWILNDIFAGGTSKSLFFSAILGMIGHGIIFLVYRYKLHDIWALTIVHVSISTLLLFFIAFQLDSSLESLLIMGILIIAASTYTTIYIKNVALKIRKLNNERHGANNDK